MLVLTRKMDEQILIGNDIKITLVRVRGNSVRIGIEAPREVRVVRGELLRDDKTIQSDSAEPGLKAEPSCEDLQLSDREQAFAHPAAQVAYDRSKLGEHSKSAKSVRKPAAETRRSIEFAPASRPSHDKNASSKLFVGSVRRDGKAAELKHSETHHAPLARFMSAQ